MAESVCCQWAVKWGQSSAHLLVAKWLGLNSLDAHDGRVTLEQMCMKEVKSVNGARRKRVCL